MRIFKAEMQQMNDDTPPAGKRPASTEPLQGRVVDPQDAPQQPRTERSERSDSADARRDV